MIQPERIRRRQSYTGVRAPWRWITCRQTVSAYRFGAGLHGQEQAQTRGRQRFPCPPKPNVAYRRQQPEDKISAGIRRFRSTSSSSCTCGNACSRSSAEAASLIAERDTAVASKDTPATATPALLATEAKRGPARIKRVANMMWEGQKGTVTSHGKRLTHAICISAFLTVALHMIRLA